MGLNQPTGHLRKQWNQTLEEDDRGTILSDSVRIAIQLYSGTPNLGSSRRGSLHGAPEDEVPRDKGGVVTIEADMAGAKKC
ncbi:hypothetical protein A2U01_0087504, partial [Trifolium medium]|nr:hypothetical protein [Trifolium medium]